MPNLENMKKRLTQNYKSSNIFKLIEIVSGEIDEVRLMLEKVEQFQNLDEATGTALELIGSNVRQYRGQANDEIYRVLILSKIARNRATGAYNNMINILSMALGVPKSEIVIDEGIEGQPQSITLIQIPLDRLAEIGMTTNQLGRIVVKLKAAGIGLKFVEFFGTFDYAGDTLITGSSTGFSNDAGTSGGTIGDLYQPAIDPDFPL